ncbi:MAG TPA: dolichyl-phosphate mannose synthase [Elusimicrobia bacterium]|nr:dolichyl-phosphate mannose synthase [Elusimicrobiota bacterium]
MNIPLLIPAYNPDHKLTDLVAGLSAAGFSDIIIVNDGSAAKYAGIFAELNANPVCRVLEHAVNMGKGYALKTGLNYFCLNYQGAAGLVTLDADGQHRPEDVRKVSSALGTSGRKLVLGARALGRNTPLRSMVGNYLTRLVFMFISGRRLTDTQTGLRGIPARHARTFLALKGDRYEYEMNMLMSSKAAGIGIEEVPIESVYIDGNKSSHFNPLLDAMLIYFLMLRFASSSIIASLTDMAIFALVLKLMSGSLVVAIVIARLGSSVVNFIVNKGFVFHSRRRLVETLLRYYLLVVAMGAAAYVLIQTVSSELGIGIIISKIIVEVALFLASFSIQRDFIFGDTAEESAL